MRVCCCALLLQVRTVSLTMGAPFLSHMATVADTGILVGRHGPLLASAVLLPPGESTGLGYSCHSRLLPCSVLLAVLQPSTFGS